MITSEQYAGAHILVVDDQKLHYKYLEQILRQEGYKNVRCIPDPFKVLSAVNETRPDLMVLDLIMPQLDGFQIIEQLNEYRQEHYLPILALCDDKSSDIRLKALQSGATDFINKPYESVEILFRIRNMIEMSILHTKVEDQNKILEDKVKERTKELTESQFDIIHRLAMAAESRDNTTGEHIVRISEYCAKLGETLGLNKDECDLLRHASPLHDVGKIGIPDSILLKPGRLTEEEFETMKTHTLIGAKLLSGSNSPIMKMAKQIALTHHEWFDGSGYPRHLKGNQIPLVGQITAICDVFDALTSERPYKKAWPTQQAVEEIIKERNTHFAPHLVDKLIEIVPSLEEIKYQHQS